MSNVISVQGMVEALPNKSPLGHVYISVNQEDFIITPKGAGVDLQHHVGAFVEISGVLSQDSDQKYIFVRTYKVLDDDAWIDDED